MEDATWETHVGHGLTVWQRALAGVSALGASKLQILPTLTTTVHAQQPTQLHILLVSAVRTQLLHGFSRLIDCQWCLASTMTTQ